MPTIGYHRIRRVGERPAHLEIFEHEASVVRRIFDDYVRKDISMRQIARGLNRDGIRSPAGRAVWGVSTIGRILRNEAYIGRIYYNRTETVPQRRHAGKTRQVPRPRDHWIAIAVPAILDEALFEAAQRISRDNARWNPRRAEPGHWLLRGLVKCGHCGVGVSCHKMRRRNGTFHRYYYCHNHDPLRAGGEHRRCPERNIRADELDTFVFEQVCSTLLRPDVLLAGEHAVSARREPVADELLQAQLAKLQRKIDAAAAERRRLADLYQSALIDRDDLLRRSKELQDRTRSVEHQCGALTAQRKELAQQNALRERIAGFSAMVGATIDHLDFEQRQKLLRLVVEQVLVRGWRVDIKLRIPLEEPPNPHDPMLSSKDRLRSLDQDERRKLPAQAEQVPTPALLRITPLVLVAHRPLPRAGRRQPCGGARRPARGALHRCPGNEARRRGAPPRARGPPMDYEDKLPTRPWYNFAPPRQYIFVPPLTLSILRGSTGARRPTRSALSTALARCRPSGPSVTAEPVWRRWRPGSSPGRASNRTRSGSPSRSRTDPSSRP